MYLAGHLKFPKQNDYHEFESLDEAADWAAYHSADDEVWAVWDESGTTVALVYDGWVYR